jgi:hypothetical protein
MLVQLTNVRAAAANSAICAANRDRDSDEVAFRARENHRRPDD